MFKTLFHYPGPLWWLWGIFVWPCAVVATVATAIPFFLTIILGLGHHAQTFIVRKWCRFMLWICRFDVEIHGKESIEPSKPFLLITNHQSLLDIPLAFEAISGDVRMVAKKELFHIPFMGWCMRVGGFIPLLRGDKKSHQKVLDQVKNAFSKGIRVWVAPEGGRTEDGKMRPFRWGSFGLAIEAGVPVQPIVVTGAYHALSQYHILPRVGAKIEVHILEPESTEGLSLEDKAKLAQKVENRIKEIADASNNSR